MAGFNEFWERQESLLSGARPELVAPIARAIAHEAWQEGTHASRETVYGNENAFPCNFAEQRFGLTKREYFAALALQGLLSNPTCVRTTEALEETIWLGTDFAREAVAMADELIRILNEKQ